MMPNIPASRCKHCRSEVVLKSVGPQHPGDETFRKTAVVKVCPYCDKGEPPRRP